ncbi:unnamed protein product [Prorocentrum cordatum]|uniref:Uncharacterized protein n=1 Tax=Prorocentrum cordatum TaxID=2364126 RepID=A0ABN9X8E0_9DINO|nr:unnamed protein product [Polarella glacialis]
MRHIPRGLLRPGSVAILAQGASDRVLFSGHPLALPPVRLSVMGGSASSGTSSSSSSGRSQSDLNNHAIQCNPNNERYQGYDRHYKGDGTQKDRDNHANQLNPNNERYQGRKK